MAKYVFQAFLAVGVFFQIHAANSSQAGVDAVRDIRSIEVNEDKLLEAVASRTLTWLTGSSANNDYISVGRTANFFGFVALRVGSGQSLSRSAVANDTLAVLNTTQRKALAALVQDQTVPFRKVQDARFAINRALEGFLVGESLSQADFLELGREYGTSEALLGQLLAQRFGELAQTLTTEQQNTLNSIRVAHISGRGQEIAQQNLKLKLSQEDKKELVNIAARFLSWTTGSEEFNDFEVVGKPSQHFGFVSLRVDSNHGVRRGDIAKEVLSMLTDGQRQILRNSATHDALEFATFLEVRGKLMRQMEVALSGKPIDGESVRTLGAAVGESEAKMTWSQAMGMLKLRSTLSDIQSADLLAMRAKYTVEQSRLVTDPVDRGRQIFAQCALCHEATDRSAIAPSLSGIVGRQVASEDSFERYSRALKLFAQKNGLWTEGMLDRFLQAPRSLIPGTYMGYDGLDKAEDRAAVIAYLKSRNE